MGNAPVRRKKKATTVQSHWSPGVVVIIYA